MTELNTGISFRAYPANFSSNYTSLRSYRSSLTYVTGSLPHQVGSAWKKVFRLSLPNDFGSTAHAKVLELVRPARREDEAQAA